MRIFIITILSVLCWTQVIAQNPTKQPKTVSLPNTYMEARFEQGKLVLKWTPSTFENWVSSKGQGYILEKQEVDIRFNAKKILGDNYQRTSSDSLALFEQMLTEIKVDFDTIYANVLDTLNIGTSTKISMAQKDSTWFNTNGLSNQSFTGLMGQILYNPDFQKSKDGPENDLQRYQYSNYALAYYPDVAEALGLGFTDETAEPNKFYKYSLKTKQGKLLEEIVIQNKKGKAKKNTNNYWFDYGDVSFGNNELNIGAIDNLASSARAYNDSIVIRWIPSSHVVWNKTIKSGYKVNKYEIQEVNGQTQATFIDSIQVTAWDSIKFSGYKNTTDSMLMVAAAAMFGNNKGTGIREQSNVFKNNYSFAVYASIRSQLASDALGMRYVDYNVEKGKKYAYKIEYNDPKYSYLSSKISVANTYKPLPAPQKVTTDSEEFAIGISMDKRLNESNYVFYFFEKSSDNGSSFQPVNTEPILFANDASMKGQSLSFFIRDSVAQNYKKYIYRVRGMNDFGEFSPWTTVEGQGIDLTPPPAPFVNEVVQTDENTVEITWKSIIPPDDFQGYVIKMSNSNSSGFKSVSAILPMGTEKYNHSMTYTTESSFYFQVASVDKNGNENSSIPMFLNVIDSIAPAIPQGLKGIIDSTGIVSLAWEHAPDKDLSGYKVYFANNPKDEFTQLTNNTIEYNFYQDTVVLNTLTEKIYYKVQSRDQRYNESVLSDYIVIERPDIIPPTTPVLLQPNHSEEGIILTWNPSTSADVETHYIYRKTDGDETEGWTLLDSLDNKARTYTDVNVAYEKVYTYTLRAMDDDSLYSEYCLPLKGRKPFTKAIGGINTINTAFDEEKKKVKIEWDFTPPTEAPLADLDYRFIIYKGTSTESMQRLIQLRTKDPIYTDDKIEGEQKYRYAIMVVYENGKKSDLSQKTAITTPIIEKDGNK
jgi:hypothetical protein